jgi:hypothetical protein
VDAKWRVLRQLHINGRINQWPSHEAKTVPQAASAVQGLKKSERDHPKPSRVEEAFIPISIPVCSHYFAGSVESEFRHSPDTIHP